MMADNKIKTEAEVFALARRHFWLAAEEVSEIVAGLLERKRAAAASRGLTAKWARVFGYIALHDPTTGEVHDVATKAAPGWAKWEAGTRNRLWKSGRRDAFDLTSAQMAKIWAEEHPPLEEEEGNVEENDLPDD
jgi:hypothetical protein